MGIAGVAVGVVLTAVGVSSRSTDDCKGPSGSFCVPKPNFGMMYGGMGVALGSGLLSFAIMPKSGELLDVINEWNTRHPAHPFELTGAGAPPSR